MKQAHGSLEKEHVDLNSDEGITLCILLDFCANRQAKCLRNVSKRTVQLLLEPACFVFAAVTTLS